MSYNDDTKFNLGKWIGGVSLAVIIGTWGVVSLQGNPSKRFIGERIDPGNVALKVNQYGDPSKRGVENATLHYDGMVRYNDREERLIQVPNTSQVYVFSASASNFSPQNQEITASLKGVPTYLDFAVNMSARTDKAETKEGKPNNNPNYTYIHSLVKELNFRDMKTFLDINIQEGLNTCANNLAQTLRVPESTENNGRLTGLTPENFNANIPKFNAEMLNCISARFPQFTFVSVNIQGVPRFPEEVQKRVTQSVTAVTESNAQIIKAEAERETAEAKLATVRAESRIKIEEAETAARVQKINLQSLNNPLSLRAKQLEYEQEIRKIEAGKWNGVKPNVIIYGTNVNAVGNPSK